MARNILTWRYAGCFALYNPQPADLFLLLDPANGYYGMVQADGELVGVCCLGREARVRGGPYDLETALDVGLALRPDLLGQGMGGPLLGALLAFAQQTARPACLRVTVAALNTPARRICQRAGFVSVRSFRAATPQGSLLFVQMIYAAAACS
jgi:RimJ/RimL family protein N-acetyltransferase